MKKLFLSNIFFIVWASNILGQCSTGSEPECACETVDVLCSVDELNGFTGSLVDFLHPQDGPSGEFCGPSTIVQNPTWFAFIAWCSDIEMEVEFTNCTVQPSGYGGAQLAVYTDCTFDDVVDCNEECVGANGTVTVNMNGLTIGESYYVMLDGCGASACDYEITVSPTSCSEEIEDWSNPVTDEETVCIGDIIDYTVDNLQGATSWHWYLDNSEIDITDNPNYTFEWPTEGMYTLCVDVSNICVDVDDDPEPNCVVITVANPNAGILAAEDNPLCPGGTAEIFVELHNDNSDYSEYFIYVNMENEVVKVVADAEVDFFEWLICENIKVYSLNFHMDENIDIPDLGDEYFGSDCVVECCDESCFTIEFVDTQPPEFDKAPDNLMLNCYYDLYSLGLDRIEDLDVEDNCADDDIVEGTETIMADTCQGGTIVREWTYMDACGLVATHTQTITILPQPRAVFTNPPIDTTLTTQEFDNYSFPNLNYTNDVIGDCAISGFVMPIIEDNRTGCSGSVRVIYEHIDSCGRTTSAIQNITVEQNTMLRDTTLSYCDVNQTGIVEVAKSDLDSLVATDVTGFTISYYSTSADLNTMTNALVFPVSSSLLPSSQVFAAVSDPLGCESELTININISPLPILMLMSEDETCLANNDGSVSITASSGQLPFAIFQDSDTLMENPFVNLGAGTYNFSVVDSLGCRTDDSATINSGIEINIIDLTYECIDNLTGTDNSDDYYDIELTVTGGQGQFELQSNGSPISSFDYNQVVFLSLPADGSFVSLTAVDVLLGCTDTEDLGTLLPCSDDCEVMIDLLTYECNDNDTPLDNSDDFYDFTINSSVINGSNSNEYNVLVNGAVGITFEYGVGGNFTLPANGMEVTIAVVDGSITSACRIEETTTALVPCSNAKDISISIESVICVDPNTPDNNNDDLFSIEMVVYGVNTASTFTLILNGQSYNYGEVILLDDFLILDGPVDLVVFDDDPSGTCSDSETVLPPAPCSSPCEVNLVLLNEQDCNNNMTGMDDADDFYFIEVSISGVLGHGSEYILEDLQGTDYGPYNYDEEYSIGPFSADGNKIELALLDASNGSCNLLIDFIQFPCSLCNHSLDLTADIMVLDCQNTISTLTAVGDEATATYLWEGPDNFTSDLSEIMILNPGEYAVTVTYMDGCVLTNDIEIAASIDAPVSNAGIDQVLNCITSVVTLDGGSSQGPQGVLYEWTDDNGNVVSTEVSFDVSQSGVYGLQLIDPSNRCVSDISYVTISENYNEPIAVITADPGNVLNCTVESINVSIDQPTLNTTYSWIVNDEEVNLNELIITEADSIMLLAVDTVSGCVSDTSLMILNLQDYPIISFDPIEKLDCETMMSCVSINTINSGSLTYNWFDSDGNLISNQEGTLCLDEAGFYSVQLVDTANNCEESDNFEIEGPLLPIIELPESISLVIGENYELMPVLNIDESDLASIEWITDSELSCYDCLNPTILFPIDSSIVSLRIRNFEGCETEAELRLSVTRVPKVYVPNVFLPEENQKFTIYSNADVALVDNLSIFDRWGNLKFWNEKFRTNDPSHGWDGRVDNNAVEQGVYAYMIKYTVNGQQEILSGTITLIR